MDEREYRIMFAVERTHWWFVSRRMFVRTLLSSCGLTAGRTGFRIADIGAGTGGMMPLLQEYGKVTGIEPDTVARTLARRRRIWLRTGSAEQTGLKPESYDMACFFDVLYHRGIHERKALREAARILKPGGWLVLTDCAIPWLSGAHDRAAGARKRYILADLARLVTREGFVIEKQTYLFVILFPLIAAKRLFDRVVPGAGAAHTDVSRVPSWVSRIGIWIHTWEAYVVRFVSFPWGTSVGIVARKP